MAHNILLVDESPLIHRVVELTMEGLDISVYSAEDTEEALTLARSLKPNIILASTTFKKNSGFDLCRALKDDAELGNIPVLLLSSAKENVIEQEALDAGAIGLLTKPFEPESLLAHVKEAISSPPPGDAAPEPEADGDILDENDAFADLDDEPLIEDPLAADTEDPLTAELEDTAAETGALAGQSAFDENDALSDLMADDDEGIPSLDELDDTIEETAIEASPMAENEEDEEASAETALLAGESTPGADMDVDEFLDEFGADMEESASEEISTEEASPSPAEEASSGEEEFDPMQLALEHTLAGEFEALAGEEPDSEEAPETASSPETISSLNEDEIDQTLQEVEDSLDVELASLAEESTLTEEEPSGDLPVNDSGLDELLSDTPDESALEAAELELGSHQAELAADFEASDEINEGGLSNLADNQVKAVEDELASLQDELAAEEDDDGASISEYGTPSSEAESFLNEMVFKEDSAIEAPPVEAEAEAETSDSEFESELEEVASEVANEEAEEIVEAVIEESAPSEDDLFWEQLEIEADGQIEKPPESPEIYAIPHEDEGEAAPLAMPQGPSQDADREFSGANVQKSLERTVENIVPALLRRIEDMVVAQLPDMVEKIVIREIDKIKRGE